jgi:glycosyltransferase involved in cell wall biosynthesis
MTSAPAQARGPSRVTVAICTWNRSALLRATLERMTQLVTPPSVSWELLVVDNNSTDDTRAVVADFDGRLPVRYLFEPVPGKSNACNRAASEAQGEYILWTDDDVLVAPDWIEAYCRAFARWPDAAVFGGRILPWFAGTPPAWLVRGFHLVEHAFAALDLGPEPLPLGGDRLPFGANMAIRAKEQRVHRYNPSLGPRPGSGLRGEEITLVREMLEAGASGWWVPEARVEHYIPEHRQTVEFLKVYYRGWGEWLAQSDSGTGTRVVLGRPLWLWREVVESRIRYVLRRLTSPPELWLKDLKAASAAHGRFSSPHRSAAHQAAHSPTGTAA